MAVVYQDNEVGNVLPHRRAVTVGDFQTEVMIFDVCLNPWVRLGHAAKLSLPIAVENNPVDVTLPSIRLPAVRFRCIEVHMDGGASRIVGVEYGLDRSLAYQGANNACGNAFAGHVGQFLVHELSGVGAALTHQAGVEPLLSDTLELTEQMEFRFFAGVAPFGVQQTLGDVEQHA